MGLPTICSHLLLPRRLEVQFAPHGGITLIHRNLKPNGRSKPSGSPHGWKGIANAWMGQFPSGEIQVNPPARRVVSHDPSINPTNRRIMGWAVSPQRLSLPRLCEHLCPLHRYSDLSHPLQRDLRPSPGIGGEGRKANQEGQRESFHGVTSGINYSPVCLEINSFQK